MDNDYGISSAAQVFDNVDPSIERAQGRSQPDIAVVAPTPAPTPSAAEAVFEIAVAAMWSDGDLSTQEVARGRVVARVLSVKPSRGGSAFAAIAAGALRFDEIAFSALDEADAKLAFATAQWVTSSETDLLERRQRFLRGLQLRLRVSDDEAAALQDVALTADAAHSEARKAFATLVARLARTPNG